MSYAERDPTPPSRPRTVVLELPDLRAVLTADAGVFSNRRVDPGTEILLRVAPPPPPRGDLLDLGSGYGAIAVALATRAPEARVWAVDVNRRALALAAENASALGLANVRACEPDEVPEDIELAAIYSNPPAKLGKPTLHALLTRWLPRLAADGRAYLVVMRNLGADSLVDWLDAQGWPTTRLRSKRGYRVLEVARG